MHKVLNYPNSNQLKIFLYLFLKFYLRCYDIPITFDSSFDNSQDMDNQVTQKYANCIFNILAHFIYLCKENQ